MILNISPKADGSIPQEQKDLLLSMGSWLKKYGEAVYSTRAWEKYGEGLTKMGAAHGIMGAPVEGTANDFRFTRSKDNTTLYAILLGWEEDQREVFLKSLSSNRINLKSLKSIELLNDQAGKYIPLTYNQDTTALKINLPKRSFEDLAYVVKLNFEGDIPPFNNYVDIDGTPYYHIIPGENNGKLVLGSDLTLTNKRKVHSNQWKLEPISKGVYKILNRENEKNGLEFNISDTTLMISNFSGKENQYWKIDDGRNGTYIISNKQFPEMILSVIDSISEGSKTELLISESSFSDKWMLKEVCELKQEAFKENIIPGIIEAEDYDMGCPEDVYHDSDEINQGGNYRPNEGVDIDKCSKGGYTIGWINTGEWLTYTVNVNKTAEYRISFQTATISDNGKMHIICNEENKTGVISIPNTAGFQNWTVIEKTIKLDSGKQVLKIVFDGGPFNLDKMVFKEISC